MAADNRPSKKQRELLSFIDGFIKGNGYGPSYREIMRALEYKSVSTVATHVDGLIARGLLQKTSNSARSLEVISAVQPKKQQSLENRIKDRIQTSTKTELEVLERAFAILNIDTLQEATKTQLSRYN